MSLDYRLDYDKDIDKFREDYFDMLSKSAKEKWGVVKTFLETQIFMERVLGLMNRYRHNYE